MTEDETPDDGSDTGESGKNGDAGGSGGAGRIDTTADFREAFADELAAVPEEHVDDSRFVPGVGSTDARVVLVGEAPGADEVAAEEPFVGSAGRRLHSALETLGIDSDEIYITNVVKVRPPDNRTPRVGEIDAWWGVLEAELALIDPAVVVPLGSTAMDAILDVDETVTDVHGQQFEREGYLVIPTFHPAAAFYDESKSDALERDLRTAFDAA